MENKKQEENEEEDTTMKRYIYQEITESVTITIYLI